MIRIAITAGSGRVQDVGRFSGADFLQIREPGLTTRELEELTLRAVRSNVARVLVNDRLDVALAAGAAGIHLRGHSISPEVVRRIAPAGFIVSVACHSAEDVRRAEREGGDYAILAPIFAPISKAPTSPPLGIEALHEIAAMVRIPVIALGGITEANAGLCAEGGAAGVAGISLFA